MVNMVKGHQTCSTLLFNRSCSLFLVELKVCLFFFSMLFIDDICIRVPNRMIFFFGEGEEGGGGGGGGEEYVVQPKLLS